LCMALLGDSFLFAFNREKERSISLKTLSFPPKKSTSNPCREPLHKITHLRKHVETAFAQNITIYVENKISILK
jgi:hypothetical protein